MIDPYVILQLPSDADDETIRRRYLELVKQYPPGQHAGKFNEVRNAYEALSNPEVRITRQLFAPKVMDSIEKILEERKGKSPRHRMTLKALLEMDQDQS